MGGCCHDCALRSYVGVFRLLQAPNLNELLAKAYSERRTIELRMPGAAHSPMRVERGAAQSRQTLPASLLEAEMILTRDAKKHVEDPNWLESQARASLLEWDYESAIRQVDNALMLKPEDPTLLQEKATAYFERAEKLGPQGAIDYGEAAEDLSKALKKNHDDEIALFNRALIFEKLHLPNDAIEDLEQLLRIEHQGAWAMESREKLERLRKLVKEHADAQAQHLADTATFLRLIADPVGARQFDQRIEDYQDIAIREWLPLAFPIKVPAVEYPTTRSTARSALQALARLLLERHQDRWLTDLLNSSSDTHVFALAVAELSEAVTKSARGEPYDSLRAATKAAGSFAEATNEPGALRAKVEQVHSMQRLHRTDQCQKTAPGLYKAVAKARYVWMDSQLGIDQAACSLTAANFDKGQSFASLALTQALAGSFPGLYMRALGIASSGTNFEGDLTATWKSDEEGLAHYWGQSASPPVRAHQFYDDLTYSAEILGEPNVALAFAQESANMLALSGNKNVEILARQHSAKIAIDAEEWSIAKAELAKVVELSASLHDQIARHSSHLYSETTLAEIDVRQGRITEAEKRLVGIEPDIASVGNVSLNLDFRRIRAQVLAQQGRHRDAENELLLALDQIDVSRILLKDSTSRQSWSQENQVLYKSLVYEEISNDDPERAFKVWERYLAAGLDSKQAAGNIKAFVLRTVAHELVGGLLNQTLVSYALLPQGLVIFVADGRGIASRLIKLNTEDLASSITSFLALCADPKSDTNRLNLMAGRLFNIFISPIAEQLGTIQTLIIETDPLTGDLPFQAMLGSDGRYLGETHTIVLSPGLLYQLQLRNTGKLSKQTRALVIGSMANVTSQGEYLQFDENALTEAREVAGRFDGATLMLREAATKENVQTALPAAHVFHFVGHALSGISEEGLLLASSRDLAVGSTLWSAQELNPKSFKRSQIVVLSACSTGRTYRTRREAHGGMVRAMLAAGVPNVVASRWDVDSVQTRRFVRAFYDALFSGKGVPDALREAEIQLIHDPQVQHPYYWAAFAAFGHA